MENKRQDKDEIGFERTKGSGIFEVPPVIIKGGSMLVEFHAKGGGGFDAPEHGKKVKLVKHPEDTRILFLEVRNYAKDVIHRYDLPVDLDGRVYVMVWDDSP